MLCSNSLSIFLIALKLFMIGTAGDGIASFKSFQCQVSEKHVYSNFSCFARSYSRSISTANCYLPFKAPLFEMFVSFFSLLLAPSKSLRFYFALKLESTLSFKYGTIYRPVMKAPRKDLCKFVNVTRNGNLLMYQFIKVLNDFKPGFIHECPYNVS